MATVPAPSHPTLTLSDEDVTAVHEPRRLLRARRIRRASLAFALLGTLGATAALRAAPTDSAADSADRGTVPRAISTEVPTHTRARAPIPIVELGEPEFVLVDDAP